MKKNKTDCAGECQGDSERTEGAENVDGRIIRRNPQAGNGAMLKELKALKTALKK